MSQAVYELLQRHPHLLEDALIIGNGDTFPAGWQTLLRDNNSQVLTWDWQTWQAYSELAPEKKEFAIPQAQVEAFRDKTIILLWPKAKALALSLIELIASQASECYAVAANDAGGKSIAKACQDLTVSSEKTDSARRCSLWQLQLQPQNDFNWLRRAQSFNWNDQAYLTLPGVFSHGKLDVGTQVLLQHLPAPAHGKLLDLGCGSGIIGLSLKQQQPKLEVTLADVDAFALRSAQLNSMRLGAESHTQASDGLQNIDGRFDYIISNPPFHQGKDTDYQFAQQLFQQAGQHLVADGQLWLVANRHLPYEDWAQASFASVELLAQQQGFKILCLSQVRRS